jgi:hypothetical protein
MRQLQNANGGTVQVEVDETSGEFQSMYVSLDVCKTFFDTICRRIVSVDAAHTFGDGLQTGRLFNSVVSTGNGTLLPLSLSAQRTEDTEGWSNHLRCDAQQFKDFFQGNQNKHVVTIATDRRREAISMLQQWFPDNPRKADIRHVIENLRKVSRDFDQGAVWACAEAPTKNAHDNALAKLPKEAAEYLTNNVKVEHYALYTFLERNSRLYGQLSGTQNVESFHNLQKKEHIREYSALQCVHKSMLLLYRMIGKCITTARLLAEKKCRLTPYAQEHLVFLRNEVMEYGAEAGELLSCE